MMTFKFNMIVCQQYINTIKDFNINIEGNKNHERETNTVFIQIEKVSIKKFLTKFLMECEKESEKSRYDFLSWLDKRKHFWQHQQGQIIGKINLALETISEDERTGMETKKDETLKFFLHNYKLIDMIEKDVLEGFSVLEESATFKDEMKTTFITPPKNTNNPAYIVLAFYYYYKQTLGEIKWFDNWAHGREEAYKEVVSIHYEKPVKSAWKQFQREYSKIEKEHSSNRYQHCNKKQYIGIMELLKDSPKALAKAKEELSKAIE